MKKLLLALTLFGAGVAQAQSVDSYIFKVETGKGYTPLTGGTNLTSSVIWDEENFKVPLGFTANIGGKSTSSFSIILGAQIGAASDTSGTINTFMPFFDSDLEDRGALTGTPKSPLRYLVTGVTPNRIFKFEAFNAGFYDEEVAYGTLKDSVNFQVWVYETSNIVEIRFGSSKITNPTDYFYTTGIAPGIGYIKDLDPLSGSFTKAHYLSGNPTTPQVDSATTLSGITTGLSAYPPSGTVYRFVPKAIAASIGEVDVINQFKVYPTQVNQLLTVEQNSSVNARAQIMSVSGQIINTSVSLTNGKNDIDVSALASGVYMLQLSTEEGNAVYKFVKQ